MHISNQSILQSLILMLESIVSCNISNLICNFLFSHFSCFPASTMFMTIEWCKLFNSMCNGTNWFVVLENASPGSIFTCVEEELKGKEEMENLVQLHGVSMGPTYYYMAVLQFLCPAYVVNAWKWRQHPR